LRTDLHGKPVVARINERDVSGTIVGSCTKDGELFVDVREGATVIHKDVPHARIYR